MRFSKILVVGGGASGMISAISALENGGKVTLVESNNRLGKKVLVTGNGRCNLTNTNIASENYHGKNPLLVNNIFSQFSNNDTIEFFNNLGVVTKVEERGRVFPMSDQASSIVDILTHRLKELDCNILYATKVTKIEKKKDGFSATLNNTTESFDRVILATGGKAVPALGSDGSGYDLAKDLGHSISQVFPSLVQLRLEGKFFEEIKGVKVDGIATLHSNDKKIKEETGEILFTHYGVSGPAILKISRFAKKEILEGKKVSITISLLKGFSQEKLEKFLEERFKMLNKKSIKSSFLGFMQKRLIPYILKASDIKDMEKRCAEVSKQERKRIAEVLLGWQFNVIDTNSFKDAQVTAGGVTTDEINQNTLESKIVPGLYFAGELLDIDGDSGGYNLQFAWSSGYVAGKNAAK